MLSLLIIKFNYIMIDLKRLLFDNDLSQRDLADIIGEYQSVISLLITGKRKLMARHIEALEKHFGKEVIAAYSTEHPPVTPIAHDATVTIFDPETINEVRQEIKNECSIPIVSNAILSQRSIDLYQYVQTKGSELSSIDPYSLVDGAEFAMEILKDSMTPDFTTGDIVFLQFLPKDAKLHSGGIYFIDTPAYAGLIRDVFIDGNIMTLKARNPKYGDIILDTNIDTYRAANIIGFFRKNFNSSYAYLRNIYDKKDEQVHRMMELAERQAEQQSKLIDLLTTR